MEKPLNQIYEILQQLTGLHRQLLETVRAERTHLVAADLNGIQMITAKKQELIESIRQAEALRVKLTGELATLWSKPIQELSLTNIIIEIQGRDQRGAEQFRSAHNTLTILIQRITEQNAAIRSLVERSLEHVLQMKKNVLGESKQGSETYTAAGQKTAAPALSRLYSGEA